MDAFTATQLEIALRLGVAAVAGMVIGIEREIRDQAAGLRTHMLVAVGACLFTIVSIFGFQGLSADPTTALTDLSRVASNVVTGVGFLGAGAIIRYGVSVRGLTTAASLWVVAAIGMAVGLGMFWAAGVAAAVTLLSLWALRPFRSRIRRAAKDDEDGDEENGDEEDGDEEDGDEEDGDEEDDDPDEDPRKVGPD